MKIRKERIHSAKFKTLLKNYLNFYNKNLKRKHITVYIISLIVLTSFMSLFIGNLSQVNQLLDGINNVEKGSNVFINTIKEKIPLVFLITFSGITPYIYIPVIGILGYPYLVAMEVMNLSSFNLVIATLAGILQIFGASLAIAAGIYYCTCSTKKYKYSQAITFGLDDVKQQIYTIAKKEEKLSKLKEKRQIKSDKREKLNVKIEYKNLLITVIVATIIVVIAAIVTGVVK